MTIRRIRRGERAYPPLLGRIPDPPSSLWLRGDAEPSLLAEPAVAIVGARAIPGLLGGLGGWTPLVALVGAAVGGMLGQMVGLFVGHTARKSLLPLPPLRIVDSAGGVLLGAVTGLALCWVMGAALLYAPGL